MYNLLIGKITKIWRLILYLRDRASSLYPLKSTVEPRSWRPWFLLLLIMPLAYYLCSNVFHKPLRCRGAEDYTAKLVKVGNNNYGATSLRRRTQTFTSAPDVSVHLVSEKLPICVLNKSQLGSVKLVYDGKDKPLNMDIQYHLLKRGGYFSPPTCRSRHKVGIMVPYRDRPTNLATFLYNIHPFVMNQKLEYRIFVIEQSGNQKFNKGRLYNAGFLEIKKYGRWKCVIFHDVDLLPLDGRILYTCPILPRHMCGTVVEITNPSFRSLFGGVTAMRMDHYEDINGYSNKYWGWGGEDNDMFWRIRSSGLSVSRYNKSIARYSALPHPAATKNTNRFQILRSARERWHEEGLSSVEYKVISVTMHHLYTHILVNINPFNDPT